jgi:hypothetical protein
MSDPITDPNDPRHRRCDVCRREGVVTTWDGTVRRCPICQRRHDQQGCPDCGSRETVPTDGGVRCKMCYADLTPSAASTSPR